jgi:arsenate-mycothiol transferase
VFVCVRSRGKSQLAAGPLRQLTDDRLHVESAGTSPTTGLNELSVSTVREVGVDISDEVPKSVTPDLVRSAQLVITLGREASFEPVAGTRVETWDTDEPSQRGIEGVERMRLIRDDIAARVRRLASDLVVVWE